MAFGTGSIKWKFEEVDWDVDGYLVHFTVLLREEYVDKFDWWGFGITDADGTMDHFDVYMIYKAGSDNTSVIDSWAPSAGAIFNDDTSDIIVASHGLKDGHFVSKFSRVLDTGDS